LRVSSLARFLSPQVLNWRRKNARVGKKAICPVTVTVTGKIGQK
jgi:hypothetical protein